METPPNRLSPLPRLHRGLPAVVSLATLAAFSPILGNGFVDWDDQANFVTNGGFRGLGWDQLRWMATTFHRGVYQPLAWLLAGVEYQLGGVEPWVFHAGSWLLHGIAALLVYVLARRLFVRLAPERGREVALAAASAALLWAVHPLRVEAVAWASAQGYPLAAVFALGSILAWLRGRDGELAARPPWYLASVALALCAYLAKPVAVTLPALVLILEWYLTAPGASRATARTWLALLPYTAPAVLVAAAAPVARATLGTSSSAGFDLLERLAQVCYGVSYYALKTLIPAHLTVFTPLPRPFDPFEFRFVVAAIGLGVVGGLVWWTAPRAKGLAAALLAYLVLLAPVLGLVRQGDQLVADRYSYFAGVPLALALAGALLVAATRGAPRRAIGLVMVTFVIVASLGASTWNLTRVWRDAGTLWAHAVAVDPASYQAHTNLGLYELRQERYDAAIRAFDTAITLNPGSSNARFARGLALAKSGRTDEAIASYRTGLALDPADATAHAHVAELLVSVGRLAEAEAEYRAALRLVRHPDLFNSLGTVLAQLNRLDEAAAAFREALALDPTHEDARANLETSMAMGAVSENAPH